MDDRMNAVLDRYHDRIRAERARPRQAPGAGEPDRRLRAVGPDTGRLLNALVRGLDAPRILELGTSYGYSTLWLADGARASGGHVTTVEIHGYKSDEARAASVEAGLAGHVEFRVGDAVALIRDLPGPFDLVLIDLWKDLYVPCLEALPPRLAPGAILVADNVGPGNPETRAYAAAVRAMPGMRSLHLPVGQGLEVSRYREPASPGPGGART